jgi:hypothetical protein
MKNAKILHYKEVIRKYGELYKDFYRSNRTSIIQLLYQVFWMYRRVVVVVCIFYMSEIPSIQIGFLM